MVKAEKENAVRKSVRVRIPVKDAFAAFVDRMGTWWPPDHQIGSTPFQAIVVEPRIGGRWFERDAQGNECLWGWVRAWDPPRRVAVSWHLGPDWKFDPNPEKASEVEIRFIEEGPAQTLVELEHSAFERHGEGYEQLRAAMGSPGAWEQTLAAFSRSVEGR